jgi:membrane protease YdiL (CAAX protease family)
MTTTSTVLKTGAVVPAPISQLSLPMLLAFHLVPGALMTLGFVALAPLVEAAGYPPIAALLAAILLVLVPLEIGMLAWMARTEGVGILQLIPYRRSLPRRDWLWLVPTLIALAFLGFGIHMLIEPQLIQRFFGWLPEWFVTPIVADNVANYSATAWLITLAAYFALNGLVGPIVEELYFRGFLLPRMDRLGRWAPLVNVSLFSLYHFWSPWQFFARILGLAPTVYAVRWKRNVYLGMAVHCSLNTLGVLIVAMLVVGRL